MHSRETNVVRTSEVQFEIASQRSRANARVGKLEPATSGDLLVVFAILSFLHRRTDDAAGVEALETQGQKNGTGNQHVSHVCPGLQPLFSSFIAVCLNRGNGVHTTQPVSTEHFLSAAVCGVGCRVPGRLQIRRCVFANSAISAQKVHKVACHNIGHSSIGGDESRCKFSHCAQLMFGSAAPVVALRGVIRLSTAFKKLGASGKIGGSEGHPRMSPSRTKALWRVAERNAKGNAQGSHTLLFLQLCGVLD